MSWPRVFCPRQCIQTWYFLFFIMQCLAAEDVSASHRHTLYIRDVMESTLLLCKSSHSNTWYRFNVTLFLRSILDGDIRDSLQKAHWDLQNLRSAQSLQKWDSAGKGQKWKWFACCLHWNLWVPAECVRYWGKLIIITYGWRSSKEDTILHC